jgi:hypothetical protein
MEAALRRFITAKWPTGHTELLTSAIESAADVIGLYDFSILLRFHSLST